MNLNTISVSKVKKSLKLFIILSLMGLTAVFFYSSFSESYNQLKHISPFKLKFWDILFSETYRQFRNIEPIFIFVAIGLNAFDWIIGSLRIYALSKILYPELKFSTSFKSSLGNTFLGGITPSQTGGGAAQVYVLYKDGMKLSKAIVSSLVCFLLSIIFLVLCFVYLVFIHKVDISNAILKRFSQVTVSIFLFLLGLFLLSITKPSAFAKIIHKILKRLPGLEHILEKKHRVETFLELILEYRDILKFYLENGKISLLIGFICTSIIYLNKFTVAYIIVRGMGIEVPYLTVLYIQMVLIVIFYFSPTPGASGVAETSAAILMSSIIKEKGAKATFVILWRTFTLYISIAVGGIIFLRYLINKSKEEHEEEG